MIVVLTKPWDAGHKVYPKGTEIDLESNTAKKLIQARVARKPGFINKIKSKF